MFTSTQLISDLRFLTKPDSIRSYRHSYAHPRACAPLRHRSTHQPTLHRPGSSAKPVGHRRTIAYELPIGPAQPSTQPLPKPRWRSMTLLSLTTLSIGYLVGAVYPPNPITQSILKATLKPAPLAQSPHPTPSDPLPSTSATEHQLLGLPIVKDLSSQPHAWSSFRPFHTTDPRKLAHSLTYSTLRGPGKFAIPPLVFINRQKTEAVIVIHVGDLMCGHDGIVHGGLLATICDEGLAALAFSNLPSHIGVTASLKLNYRKPVMANQFIVLRSWIPADQPPKGRKVWSNGRIENLSGDVLVEAESLFVEPKMAKFIGNSQIKEYMQATGKV